jgi:predicted aspartyl protease
MQAAIPLLSGKWGSRRRQLVGSPSAAAVVEGRPRLHPTTRLPIPAVNTIHMFSAQSKLCFVRDRLSGKEFLVDTGATLSLLPHQSAAAATGPKLQSVKGQPIKTWNFVNMRVEFNGWERKFAFLRADVPFPIIGLDFLRFFGMQVDPSSSEILVPTPSQRSQGGGTDSSGGKSAAHVCFSAKKEAPVPQPKVAAGACPIHPRIKQLLEEFPGLVRPAAAAPQPRHGVVHHSRLTVGLFLPNLGDWSWPRGRWLKKNSPPSKKQVSFLAARRRCTWCPRRMSPGGRVATTVASTLSPCQTGTPCPT